MSTSPHDALRDTLLRIAGPEGREDVMTFGQQLIEQGRQEGRMGTLRANIESVLQARAIALTAAGRDRLASCDDVATLTRWFSRALTAGSAADVFEADAD
jgi:hypothetical protein